MDYQQLETELKAKRFKPFYLFYGENDFLMEEAVALLASAFLTENDRLEILPEDTSLGAVMEKVYTGDIFAARKIIKLKEPLFLDKGAKEEEEAALLQYIESGPGDTIIVVLAARPDKRRKLFRRITAARAAYLFAPLKGRLLLNWVVTRAASLGKRISREAAEMLAAYAGDNIGRLARELEKIALYLGEEETIEATAIETMVSPGLSADIFALVDSLGEGDRSIKILKEMLFRGEPPVKILFMISRQLQLLYRARFLLEERLPAKEVASRLSLAPFAASKVAAQSRKWTEPALAGAIKLTRDTDRAIKTGAKPPALALEMLLLGLNNLI
ncbi:MAG TPA: DNA polymerase III subunit delta [Firmicutes bacterium]|nr:DNA polymerase III subunit delta [Bacillota bacterium]